MANARWVPHSAPNEVPGKGGVIERLKLEHLGKLQQVLAQLLVVQTLQTTDSEGPDLGAQKRDTPTDTPRAVSMRLPASTAR